MLSKVTRRASPRIFAAIAICSVVYLWANFLHRQFGTAASLFPIGLLIAASLLSLTFRFALAGREGKARRVIYIAWSLALAIVSPLFVGQTLGQISLLSMAVFLTIMLSLDLGRRDWSHRDSRELMTLTSIFFGIVVFVSAILGHTYQPPYVLIYLIAMILAVTLARDLDVQAKVGSIGSGSSGITAGVTIVIVLILVGLLSTGILFGFSSTLATLGAWAREIFMLLLYPFGLLAHGLVLLLRLLLGNLAREDEVPPEDMAPPADVPIEEHVPNLIMALGLVVILIVVMLVVAYFLLRPSRKVGEDEVREERESLLSQAFTNFRFRLPRLRRPSGRTLVANPQDVYQVFAWLEYWGQRRGRARRREETVAEYSVVMEQRFLAEDVREVSTSFEQAKYAEQSLTAPQWQRVRSAWGRLKKQFELLRP